MTLLLLQQVLMQVTSWHFAGELEPVPWLQTYNTPSMEALQNRCITKFGTTWFASGQFERGR